MTAELGLGATKLWCPAQCVLTGQWIWAFTEIVVLHEDSGYAAVEYRGRVLVLEVATLGKKLPARRPLLELMYES